MFSNMCASRQPMLRSIFLFLVLFFISFNFIIQLPLLINSRHVLKAHQVQPIGRRFIPLIPFLKQVSWAGYATCLNSSGPLTDVAIMGPYQKAQYALAPTILDYFHPFDYHYLVYQCPGRMAPSQFQGKLSSYVIVKTFRGVTLLSRKKEPS